MWPQLALEAFLKEVVILKPMPSHASVLRERTAPRVRTWRVGAPLEA